MYLFVYFFWTLKPIKNFDGKVFENNLDENLILAWAPHDVSLRGSLNEDIRSGKQCTLEIQGSICSRIFVSANTFCM